MAYYPKWKIFLVVAVVLLGLALAAPNLLTPERAAALPSWLPNKQVALGLDLQGGSHLLAEVDVSVPIREHLENLADTIRTDLRQVQIHYQGLGVDGNGVRVTILDKDRLEEAKTIIHKLARDMDETVDEQGRISLVLEKEAIERRKLAVVEQSIEVVRRRIDEFGVREPTIQRQGEGRILLQLPGVDDPERIKAQVRTAAKMTFHLVDEKNSVTDAIAGRVPPGSMLLPLVEDKEQDGRPRMILVQKRVSVSGENLIDAQPGTDARTNEPVVNFRFDSTGGKRFGDVTKDNVGHRFAIVLDGKVVSAPVIREPILGGTGQISGRFSFQQVNDLSVLLRAGALPAPLVFIEERTVGPGLGADSIAAGKMASLISIILVGVFMVASYGLFGLMANVAVVVNMVLIIALLSALQATLTLPGIAGIVLTIGMAVDANVLIFERMREETRAGRTPFSAVEAGFSRAATAIIDSNLTTLVAGLLLFQFGGGPVRGFAVTLSVGIATSMFTAIMVTRLLIVIWLRWARPKALAI